MNKFTCRVCKKDEISSGFPQDWSKVLLSISIGLKDSYILCFKCSKKVSIFINEETIVSEFMNETAF